MKLHSVTPLFAGLALSAACTDSSDEQTTQLGTTAIYSPTTGNIPLPNDLLFSGSTDATLNAPGSTDPAEQSVIDALNSLDGWGTNSAFNVPFSAPLDPSTVIAESSVRLFEVTLNTAIAPVGGPVSGVVRELAGTAPDPLSGLPLDPLAEYMALAEPTTQSSVLIVPLRAFSPKTSYMLNLTNAILDGAGDPVTRSIVYQLASSTTLVEETDPLAALQGVILAMHAAATTQGIDPDEIVISSQFSTQSVDEVMQSVAAVAAGNEALVIAALCLNPALVCSDTNPNPDGIASVVVNPVSIGDTGSIVGSPANQADVYVGAVTLPYYLSDATPGGPNATDLTSDDTPLTDHWLARYPFGAADTTRNLTRFNTLPAITETETAPLLVTVPKGVKPVNGWPLVVFQHGITRNRTDVFALADALAIGGFASVSMDLPLHGLDSSSTLFTSYQDDVTRERTFGLDLFDNSTGAPGPDGLAEPSGQHFQNLTALRVSRDNLRQAAADILALFGLADQIDIDGDTLADFDANDVHFLGHSLGAIVGGVALPFSTNIQSATLAMPGGGLAKLFAGSETYGPILEAGLAAAGILAGTPEFEQFLFSAQTVNDSADPLNFAAQLRAADIPLHALEIVGIPGTNPSDDEIPNSVPGAPLSGTEPYLRELELAAINDDTTVAEGIFGAVRFSEGAHDSLLLPSSSAAAFTEIQDQAVEFASTNGQMITIGDDDIVLGGPGAN